MINVYDQADINFCIPMKKPYLLILLVMLSACSDSGDDQNREIDLVVLEDLIEHTKEFEKRVYSYENGLHIAVGQLQYADHSHRSRLFSQILLCVRSGPLKRPNQFHGSGRLQNQNKQKA